MSVRAATPDEIERLLFHMPTVACLAPTEWAAGFAKSVIGQSRRKHWRPSEKQIVVMRELVSDLFRQEQEDDFQLVE
jgi:hypothetical protein